MKPKAIVIVDRRGVLSSKNNYDLNRRIEYANGVTKADQISISVVRHHQPST
jgi:hypothetical protein